MLENIEKQIQPYVYKEAEEFILLNDRNRFDSVFTVIETFTIDNNAIIGGLNGINLLAGVPKSKDSYQYEIYIERPDENARKLADLIYDANHKYINKDTIRLETRMKGRIYELWVEGRSIAKIYALLEYRGIRLFLLLNPVRAYGYFVENKKVYAMSPEIQLIDIYRRMYNPYPASRLGIAYDTYETLLDNEAKLYKVIAEDITSRASGIEEDIMSISRAEGGNKYANCKNAEGGGRHDKGGDAVKYIAKRLIKEMTELGAIVVGDYALRELIPDYSYQDRLQLLTVVDVDSIKKIVQKIAESNKDSKLRKIISVRYPLNLPNDIQIEKHSLYLDGDKQIFICDVFNSPSYEVIPYVSGDDGTKWGNLLVCLRFKFIDLYVTRLINNLREGKDPFIIKKINHIANSISRVRNRMINTLERSPLEVFQIKNYEGIFVQPNVLLNKKLEAAPGGRKFYPKYYPTKRAPSEIKIKNVTPE